MISEKLIAKLIGHDGSIIRCEKMVENESNLTEISKVIFSSRKHSSKVKDLLTHLKVWARILLECIHPRTSTNSSNYINGDKQNIHYYIESEKKVNLHALLFQHLRDTVRYTRDSSKRTEGYISMGRLISNILMESQLIDSLTDDHFSKGMQPLAGRMLNAKDLKNMRIINEVISPPTEFSKDIILNIMIPLKDLPIFSKPYSL